MNPRQAAYRRGFEHMKLSIQRLLGPLAAILLVAVCAAAVNYYLGLGWFGSYGKFALSKTLILVCILVILSRQVGKDR